MCFHSCTESRSASVLQFTWLIGFFHFDNPPILRVIKIIAFIYKCQIKHVRADMCEAKVINISKMLKNRVIHIHIKIPVLYVV